MAENKEKPKAQGPGDPPADDPPADDPTKYLATHKKYVAKEDFEGNVGLAVVKLKKDAEIKDQHLALQLLDQGLPVDVTDVPVTLTMTNPDKYKEVAV